ncbi:type II toxin-antitoxin system VapC family toxin [Zunongwangia profunda]|uniref:type II toxin-antitoxin system VapC family toxin n=1 Tax=Zunongwangia profunda TaxID=398743 RepID=UPI001D180B56|nr:type II toxin-antitoxin system VapC family toxin [Zunongwangia profunda]MCC4227416.1 type II toxin-antitoxin system VapC family toxin [Zunongwangia profunda]|tara:strand:- start:3505 stop:3873 length:369 start_codon:yes stop_codon:yes gene_type:complete
MKLILDSNVFDDLLTGKLEIAVFEKEDFELFITHIQVDEINECPNKEKRAKLLNFMIELRPEKIPTESFVVGTSRIGSAKIGDGNLIERLRTGNLKKTNDALIGETAIKNNLTLITNDLKIK